MIADDLDTLDAQQLRDALRAARAESAYKQAVIEKLTHENALLKRLKVAAQSERFNAEQKSLLDETLDSDLAAGAAVKPGHRRAATAPAREAAATPAASRCLP